MVVALGVAAINTGNNLLYLLVSLVLGLIVVSGVLSEQTMRGLRLTGAVPEEIYAGRPALFGKLLEVGHHSLLEKLLSQSEGHPVQAEDEHPLLLLSPEFI